MLEVAKDVNTACQAGNRRDHSECHGHRAPCCWMCLAEKLFFICKGICSIPEPQQPAFQALPALQRMPQVPLMLCNAAIARQHFRAITRHAARYLCPPATAGIVLGHQIWRVAARARQRSVLCYQEGLPNAGLYDSYLPPGHALVLRKGPPHPLQRGICQGAQSLHCTALQAALEGGSGCAGGVLGCKTCTLQCHAKSS